MTNRASTSSCCERYIRCDAQWHTPRRTYNTATGVAGQAGCTSCKLQARWWTTFIPPPYPCKPSRNLTAILQETGATQQQPHSAGFSTWVTWVLASPLGLCGALGRSYLAFAKCSLAVESVRWCADKNCSTIFSLCRYVNIMHIWSLTWISIILNVSVRCGTYISRMYSRISALMPRPSTASTLPGHGSLLWGSLVLTPHAAVGVVLPIVPLEPIRTWKYNGFVLFLFSVVQKTYQVPGMFNLAVAGTTMLRSVIRLPLTLEFPGNSTGY